MLRPLQGLLVLALVGCLDSCLSSSGVDLSPRIEWPQPSERVELWREDLDSLARQLSERHVAPFRKVSRETFSRSVQRLHGEIPELDDTSVVIEMARLAASIGDGHTGFFLSGPRIGLRPGPLWLMGFEDGVFVKGVVGALESDVLNLQLVRIGGVEVEQALERLAPLIPGDNVFGKRGVGIQYLNVPRVLYAVGLSEEPDAVRYTFLGTRGEEIELRCSELDPSQRAVFGVRYGPGARGAPLAERLGAKPYAFERIEGDALLVYSACRNGPEETFRVFCKRVFADMDRNPPRQLVIDLRRNTGGNSQVSEVLRRELRRRPALTQRGRLKVLIGNTTFSSGMWVAVDLAREFDATLVGEPTGGTPNAPGHRGVIVLPNSSLDCGFSRRLWERGGAVYTGEALRPDVLVRETSAQHFAGRDPVLEAALEGVPD